jgi:hypothetical protein
VLTSSAFSTSRAARVLDDIQGESSTLREAVFWALAAASARGWAYALKWFDLAEQEGTRVPRTIDAMRREWSLALEREAVA